MVDMLGGIGNIGSTVGNFKEGLQGSWANSFYTAAGSTGNFISVAIICGMLFAVVAFVAYRAMAYKTKAVIWKTYSMGIKETYAKVHYKKGKDGKYRAFKVTNLLQLRPQPINFINQECLVPCAKGERIYLYQVGIDDYKQVRITEALAEATKDIKLTILDHNSSNLTIQLHKEVVDKHRNQNKLALYLPTIMMVIGGIIVCVMLWMTLGRIETMNQTMLAGYQAMADAVKDFGKQMLDAQVVAHA
jgi:hypothetical protein